MFPYVSLLPRSSVPCAVPSGVGSKKMVVQWVMYYEWHAEGEVQCVMHIISETATLLMYEADATVLPMWKDRMMGSVLMAARLMAIIMSRVP